MEGEEALARGCSDPGWVSACRGRQLRLLVPVAFPALFACGSASVCVRLTSALARAPQRSRRLLLFTPAALLALLATGAPPALAATPETPEMSVQAPVHATTATFLGILNPGKEGGFGTFEAGTYEFISKQGASCEGGSKAPSSPAISLGGGHEELPAQTVTGLEASTEYTVCLLARSGTAGEETLSAPVTFTTATPAEEPETTGSKTVTSTTAMLEGVLNPKAKAPVKAGWYFAYSAGASCTSAGTGSGETAHEPAEGQALSEATEATGMEPNREYRFCLIATDEAGNPTPGDEAPLKTLPLAPATASESASEVKSTEAQLGAQINPENETTSDTFEYATSEASLLKGEGTQAAGAPLAGFPEQHSSVTVTGLSAGTTYFYRVRAENEQSGTEGSPVVSPPQSFTTVPTPFTDGVEALTATTAKFNGHLTPANETVSTQYHFDYKLRSSECAGSESESEGESPTVEAGTGKGTEVKATATARLAAERRIHRVLRHLQRIGL